MKAGKPTLSHCSAVILFCLLAGCVPSPPGSNAQRGAGGQLNAAVAGVRQEVSRVKLGGQEYRISGPYSHENVSVYLLHGRQQDGRDFLTLDEGLKARLVRVREKDQEDVNQVLISNASNRPLFLQEGDIIKGGKQDRTLYASMVVPPNTKEMAVPAFCVEPDRWQAGAGGEAFAAPENVSLAPKSVRQAAKFEKDQSRVWEQVAEEKEVAQAVAAAPSTTSSLNEAMDSAGVRKVSEAATRALGKVVAEEKDAVGVAIALNGRVEEVNIYPGHRLLQKLYPRLLSSYAVQATAGRRASRAPAAPPAAVAEFMKERKPVASRAEQINGRNSLRIQDYDDSVQAVTEYNGAAVHQQIMSRDRPAAGPKSSPPAVNPAPRSTVQERQRR